MPPSCPFSKVDTPADNAKTLCEQLTLRGLIRQSTPEYKPTPERLAFYPRKAYYKREKVKAELERVITDAKAEGLPAESVDRVYLGGEEAILEHERRNGYDRHAGATVKLRRRRTRADACARGAEAHSGLRG
jgi:hypothetical protein